MNVGTHLRTSRERLGLSVTDIAARTKISARILRALEEGDAAALPPPIFVRGFLRSYAREVGLDAEETVRAYNEETAATLPPPSAPTLAHHEDFGEELVIGSGDTVSFHGDRPTPASTLGALALAAVALAIVGYLGLNGGATEPPPPTATPSDAVGTSGVGAAPTETAGDLTLAIHPTGPCWVEVRVNGEARVYRLMQGGERETVTAKGDLMLRVGDPTAFAYTINGRPGRPLGITSQPVSIRINRETLPSLIG